MEADIATPAQDLLRYNETYQIIICRACQYAIQPAAVDRHLKEIHAIHGRDRRPYTDYVATLPLSHPSRLLGTGTRMVLGEDEEFPVAGITVISGLQCLSPGCAHLCVSVKRMQSHWKVHHQAPGCAALDWQSVPIQTFFRGSLLRYFTHPDLTVERPLNTTTSVSEQVAAISEMWKSHDDVDKLDSDLLAHYLYVAYSSLANRHANARLWQISVPRIATSHSFLRHGILALSAQHLLSTDEFQGIGRRQLEEAARNHCGKSMEAFQAIISVKPSSALECHAIIAYIHLYTLFSFATYENSVFPEMGSLFIVDVSRPDMDYLSPWLFYVRHGCQLVCGFWDTIGNGPLASLAASWEIPIMVEDERSSEIVSILLSALDGSCFHGCPLSNKDEEIYSQAAREMAPALNAAYKLGSALTVWDAIRLWPLTISVEFVREIKEETPQAIMLLACYCIILSKLSDDWFARGLSEKLLSNIRAKLEVGQCELVQEVMERIKSVLS